MMHRSRLAAVAVSLLAGMATPALAQGVLQQQLQPKLQRNDPQRAPAALPGAQSAGPVIDKPITGTAGMKPNEALFDAVNRGDIGSAREALNRGADVDARNVLGLTPVELSVDLGRNDITFLLLTMRGTGSGDRTAPPARTPAARVAANAPHRAPAVPVAASVRPAPAPARQVVAATPSPGTDPGIPAPQAGFLGFGSRP